jgi:hypothetical protein
MSFWIQHPFFKSTHHINRCTSMYATKYWPNLYLILFSPNLFIFLYWKCSQKLFSKAKFIYFEKSQILGVTPAGPAGADSFWICRAGPISAVEWPTGCSIFEILV